MSVVEEVDRLKEIYDYFLKSYGQGDYEQALSYLQNYMKIKDEVADNRKEKKIRDLERKMVSEKKSQEEELSILKNVEIKKKNESLERLIYWLSKISEVGLNLLSAQKTEDVFHIFKTFIYHWIDVNILGMVLYSSFDQSLDYTYFEKNKKAVPNYQLKMNEKKGLGTFAVLYEKDIFIRSTKQEIDSLNQLYPDIDFRSSKSKSQSIIYCRMLNEGECIGLITIQSVVQNAFTLEDYKAFQLLASYLAIAISNIEKKNLLLQQAESLRHMSYYDSLTGLKNRRSFNERINDIHHKSEGLSGMIVGDLNGLKTINDQYGHAVGDDYLIASAQLLKMLMNPHAVYRLDGDEFAVIVEGADFDLLSGLVKKVMGVFSKHKIQKIPFSISLGYAIQSEYGESLQVVFSKAESEMYREKEKHYMG